MHSDFEYYGGAVGLVSCYLYGGTPYPPQEMKIKRGVDIVIGTPGRIKVVFCLLFNNVLEHFCYLCCI